MKLAKQTTTEKEALSWEDVKGAMPTWEGIKERFKATDPRIWSTPMGMAAGVALMKALGDPSKASRLRYALAAGAGGAAGFGAGHAIKEFSMF